MRSYLIACGNPLRRDDGVAHAVLELLGEVAGATSRAMLQLTPEVSADVAAAETVIFVDADLSVTQVTIERVEPREALAPGGAFTHASSPDAIIALARALFGFDGEAFVCRVPAPDVSPGEGLSEQGRERAAQGAECVRALLARRGHHPVLP